MLKTLYSVVIAYFALILMGHCHEWSHSLVAVIFDVKSNILDITYSSHPLMLGIHEKVDYDLVATLPGWQGILISFAGLAANLLFIILTLPLIMTASKTRLSKKPNFLFFTYIFAFWNICEWFNYMVIRNIFPRGDIANMIQFGFPHSALLILGIVTSITFFYLLFGPERKQFSKISGFSDLAQRVVLYTLLSTFVIYQAVILYNSLFMYSEIQVGPS